MNRFGYAVMPHLGHLMLILLQDYTVIGELSNNINININTNVHSLSQFTALFESVNYQAGVLERKSRALNHSFWVQ